MPYINPENRPLVGPIALICAEDAGELNYAITSLVTQYLEECDEINYRVLNEVIGVLECAKLELYRRMIAPYEDQKCFDNGDVYNA